MTDEGPEAERSALAPPSAPPSALPSSQSSPLLPSPRRAPEGAAGEVAGPLVRERRRHRSRGASAVVLLLVAAVAAALALSAHLWGVAEAWRGQAQDAAAQRDRLASTSAELQRHLDEVQAALDASDARVEQLAAETARATDLREARTR